MPTYEFRCTDCGNLVEIFQRIGDDPLTVCELCGGTLRKVFHPAGIVFKGSGFYATDSRKAKATSSSDGKGASGKGSDKAHSGESGSEKGGSKSPSSEAGSKGKKS
jgi:putative FmdB family regulatory protein